jgi:hypothetical protein
VVLQSRGLLVRVQAETSRYEEGSVRVPAHTSLSVARQQPATSFFVDGAEVSGAGSSPRGVSVGRVKAASPLPPIGEGDLRE